MSIRSRLILTTVIMALLLGFIGAVLVFSKRLEHKYQDEITELSAKAAQAEELSDAVERQFARVQFFLVTRDSHESEEFSALSRLVENKLREFGPVTWEKSYKDLIIVSKSVFSMNQYGDNEPLPDFISESYLTQAGKLLKDLSIFTQEQSEILLQKRKRARAFISRTRFISIAGILIGIAGVIISSILIAYSISKPLSILHSGVLALGKGEPVHLPVDGNDEFSVVNRAFNRMVVQLKELDQMKQDFVASVTHELRSPLSAGQSFVDLVLGEMDTAVSRQAASKEELGRWHNFLSRLKNNMVVLNRFITDLLEVAKIERGKLECNLKSGEVTGISRYTLEFFAQKAKQKNINLSLEMPQGSIFCLVDIDRVRQVLVNLIDNAIKFAPFNGKVLLKIEPGTDDLVKFYVTDNGPGIPPERRDVLFSKFGQIKETHAFSGGARGTGLGLFIVKSIVESHGGKIWVESQVGKGTTFMFVLRKAQGVVSGQ
ncbi:sensor histidine kinase [Elusimicrobiota bacterium]